MRLPSYQQLSKEQDKAINLPLQGSYLVAGPPGTGKTVVALYRASMLDKMDADTLLIMYSRLLSQYTEAAVVELGVAGKTKTFHQWIYGFYLKHYRRKPPEPEPYVYDWQEILGQINEDPPPKSGLPYVLVDEGQDLPKEFYPVAAHMTANLTVFADENQRITDANSTLDEIRIYSGMKADQVRMLDKNYRNTREIAELAERFYTGHPKGIPELPDRRGDRPIVKQFKSFDDTADYIARFERNNSDTEIGVFTPTTRLQRRFEQALTGNTKNPVQTYVGGQGRDTPVLDFDTPGIKIVNYRSTKGLEFDTVFIPELQKVQSSHDAPDTKMLFYVLTARARDKLYFAYSGHTEPAILSLIPKDKADRQ